MVEFEIVFSNSGLTSLYQNIENKQTINVKDLNYEKNL